MFTMTLIPAQKFFARLNRKQAEGRDFYDVVFLPQKTKTNYDHLEAKIGLGDKAALKKKLLAHTKTLNLKEPAKEVEPFLFQPSDSKKIIMFPEYIRQVEL